MKTPLGTQIQDLEKLVIQNLKETDLVEHPHFYHRNLKDPKEPLTLCYKVAEIYTREIDSYDPLIELIPLEQALQTGLQGIPVIDTKYDEGTGVHTLNIGLDHTSDIDAMDFKYQVLLRINSSVSRYLIKSGEKPRKKQGSYKKQLERIRGKIDEHSGKKKGKKRK